MKNTLAEITAKVAAMQKRLEEQAAQIQAIIDLLNKTTTKG